MRINFTPIVILTGFFVACGGTGDNFTEGGVEGGSGGSGSGGVDSSTGGGDDVISNPDTSMPPDTGGKDTSSGGSSCSTVVCTTDSECQSDCPTTSTYCCDIPTGACYPTSLSACPSVKDSGSGSSGYGG